MFYEREGFDYFKEDLSRYSRGVRDVCFLNTQGTAVIYEAMSDVVYSVRASRPVEAGWKKKIDADFRKRGR